MTESWQVCYSSIARELREHFAKIYATCLLNFSGAAGTGKSFFLHSVKIFSKERLGRDGFVHAAAPSGTAA